MNPHLLRAWMILTVAQSLGCAQARADLWANPWPTNYASPNGKFVFSVVPGMPFGYTTEISEWRRQGLDTGPTGEMAFLYSQGTLSNQIDGRLLWSRRLFNYQAPLGVLVADSGHFIVTIDDWGGNRGSTNAVVIYGQDGKLIKRFSVSDLLTPEERRHVLMSTSSYHWGAGHHIDDAKEQLVLKVVTNSAFPRTEEARYREKRIALQTGEIIPDG